MFTENKRIIVNNLLRLIRVSKCILKCKAKKFIFPAYFYIYINNRQLNVFIFIFL